MQNVSSLLVSILLALLSAVLVVAYTNKVYVTNSFVFFFAFGLCSGGAATAFSRFLSGRCLLSSEGRHARCRNDKLE